MLNDALDILNPRSRFTAEGTFWTERPDSLIEGGQKFNYEYVDPFSKTYRRLYGNIQSFNTGETAIRTNDLLPFKVGAFVMTAEGTLFAITQAAKDFQSASKQALRLLGTPLGTEYVLRLVNVENAWGVK